MWYWVSAHCKQPEKVEEEVEKSKACCRVLDCIECSGPRTFLRDGFPCIRYTNHYFVTTLLYSILLGFLGLDRFDCVL